mgnify:CR=1 FL=1
MNAHRPPPRTQRRTVLIVGEGDAEEAFLRHLKTVFVGRMTGITIKIGNAHGKGAGNVIDHTRKQANTYAYDRVAALFDTDTDWTPEVEKQARAAKIIVLPSTPCLETELLRLKGKSAPERTSDAKRSFQKAFGADAHSADLYPNHFPQTLLEKHLAAQPQSLLALIVALMRTT